MASGVPIVLTIDSEELIVLRVLPWVQLQGRAPSELRAMHICDDPTA